MVLPLPRHRAPEIDIYLLESVNNWPVNTFAKLFHLHLHSTSRYGDFDSLVGVIGSRVNEAINNSPRIIDPSVLLISQPNWRNSVWCRWHNNISSADNDNDILFIAPMIQYSIQSAGFANSMSKSFE